MPDIDNITLHYKIEKGQAHLSWSLPSGDYDDISIQQCVLGTQDCVVHQVNDTQLTKLVIDVEDGVQYVYYMLFYHGDEVVARSAAFVKRKAFKKSTDIPNIGRKLIFCIYYWK